MQLKAIRGITEEQHLSPVVGPFPATLQDTQLFIHKQNLTNPHVSGPCILSEQHEHFATVAADYDAASHCASSEFYDARSHLSTLSHRSCRDSHNAEPVSPPPRGFLLEADVHEGTCPAAASMPVDQGSGACPSGTDTTETPPSLVKQPHYEPPPWVPPEPLISLEPSTSFVPAPKNIGLEGYWAKVPDESSPNPLPIDELIKAHFVARKAHETISGIKVVETTESVQIKIKLSVWGLPSLYTEQYNKDGSTYVGMLRRDVRPGKSVLRMYFTDAGDTIFVADSFNMTGGLDFRGEERVRVLDDGCTIKFSMFCHSYLTNQHARQYFTGRKSLLPKH